MTSKEKAENLYKTFSNAANSFIEGKKCALICVDEIMNEHKYDGRLESHKYWLEVKQEIEKY